MQRMTFFLFGIFNHILFLAVFAYMAAFVANVWVQKTIDAPVVRGSTTAAVMIDLLLLAAFAVPHSVMARPTFKRWWTQFVPTPVERSVYVFVSNLLMIALLVFWRPIDTMIFELHQPVARTVMWSLFAFGWLLVPAASLMINHFDLFGTRQVWLHLRRQVNVQQSFRTPMLYAIVRHPLYVGWIIAFWATPSISAGHLLFASTLTIYMLIAIQFEERNLVETFGDDYIDYRRRVGGLIPRPALPPAAGRSGVCSEVYN